METEPNTVGLDPEWVAAHAAIDGQVPVSAEFKGFIGTGQMSRNARFALGWGTGDGPDSVVVKLPSAETSTRSMAFQHLLYNKECDFYSAVLPLVDVTTPKPLAVHLDPAVEDFAIILEYLTGSEQGDHFDEPSPAHLDLAIEQLAALQAPVWGRVDRPEFGVYQQGLALQSELLPALFPAFLPPVFDRLGPGLDSDVADLLEQLAGQLDQWLRLCDEATTLVHGDYRPDNFMFGLDQSAPALAIVDWQTLTLGTGVTDLAYLLAGALEIDHRRSVEHELLRRYRHALANRGVDYPETDCLADYVMATIHGVLVAVMATTMADETERGDALFTLMINRHGTHALDLDVLGRINSSRP